MKDKFLRTKMVLVAISIGLVGIVSFGLVPVARAGFKEDFERANDWDSYKGDVEYKNARLIQNVTAVLHRENLEILKQIEELKAEVLKLKDMVEAER